jgi:hypothetical protein
MRKSELLEKIEAGRRSWVDLLNSIPEDRRAEPGACGEWSVKDVLVHMNFWQANLVTTLFTLRQGGTPRTVNSEAEVQENNTRWYEQGQDRPWELAWADSEGLHRQILRRVAEFSDEELNQVLQGKPLWERVGNDTWGHVEEHSASIQKWI